MQGTEGKGDPQRKLLQEKLVERNERLSKLREQLEERNKRLHLLRDQITARDGELEALRTRLAKEGADPGGLKAENVVWIFGAGRTGSTWLAAMMGGMENSLVWFEPQLGELFDPDRMGVGVRQGRNFVLAQPYRTTWLGGVRGFVLNGAAVRFPEATGETMLVVKEPHGSAGAPLLTEALPESRVILLLRDPRDTIASALDAYSRGMWHGDVWKGMYGGVEGSLNDFVEGAARSYLRHVGNAKRAFDAHPGPKVVVRYEELRLDALHTLAKICSTLKIPTDDGTLRRVTKEHAWESIAEEEKGQGRFYRKAAPGSWRQDLSEGQAEIVENITAPIIEEFYAS